MRRSGPRPGAPGLVDAGWGWGLATRRQSLTVASWRVAVGVGDVNVQVERRPQVHRPCRRARLRRRICQDRESFLHQQGLHGGTPFPAGLAPLATRHSPPTGADRWPLTADRPPPRCQDGELLRQVNIDKIRHIPTSIVQGRYDCVCPATSAFELHQRFPEAAYHLVHAGHSAAEPEIQDVLLRAAEEFAKL